MAETFGDILIEAREDAGLAPADLAKITKIPPASIRALESNDFEVLPAPVFVRGFIRAYCREVDVDPSEALMAYDAHLHEEEIVSEALADDMGDRDRTAMGPLLFVGTDNMPAASSGRGLQIGHMLLLLLALVTFIIAYVTAGLPSQSDHRDAVQMDRASTTTSTTNTSSPPARPTNNQ